MPIIQIKNTAAQNFRKQNNPSREKMDLKSRSGRKRAKKRATGFLGNFANSSAFLRARSSSLTRRL